MDEQLQDLKSQVRRLEAENLSLRARLQESNPAGVSAQGNAVPVSDSLSLDEYKRYGRQMIVPGFGSLSAQLKLKRSRVLVIGAGGLGCPALLYLCGAGIGRLGILDDDIVDYSNLHRQVLHTTDSVGMLKCDSAKRHLNRLNPNVSVMTYPVRLVNQNAFGIIEQFDLVVDCTDTPATRYLINDVCVLLGKTVISGSGVKTDGQFTVLNFENRGPCYRCLYPQPPAPESVSSCGDAGVLGPAIGLTGIALATETIKVITGYYKHNFAPFLASYSAYPQQSLRVFKMRGKKPSCAVCSDQRTITKLAIENCTIDYAAFCGARQYNVIAEESRRSVQELHRELHSSHAPLLLDVRPPEQFEIASLPNSINIDWERKLSKLSSIDSFFPEGFDKERDVVFTICRYGNDSQLAAQRLSQELGFKNVYDVKGGLNRWSQEVDENFPVY